MLEDDPAFLDLMGQFLEFMAARTGNKTYMRAARTLFQLPPGLPEIDDSLALDEVATLLAEDRATSTWAACLVVAQTRCMGGDPASYAKRLQRKWSAFHK